MIESSSDYIPRLALNHREAATALGISERTLTTWANNPSMNVPRFKAGRLSRYPVAALEQWLAARLKGEDE